MAEQIGAVAGLHAARHDREASFVHEGYTAIRASGYGLIAVPEPLGGAGHGLATVCQAQATLAGRCASTALAIAMHQHSVLTLAWRWRQGDHYAGTVLRRIAAEGLLLAASGSADPLKSRVVARPASGGMRVSGRKKLCSGAPGVDLIVTPAVADNPDSADGAEILSVLIPAGDPGVQVVPDWDGLGMRGSGSNSVTFTSVFVPEANIGRPRPAPRPADRPRDHSRRPGLQLALAVIASVYLGIARSACDHALRLSACRTRPAAPAQSRVAGELTAEVHSGRWALDALVAASTDDALGTDAHYATTMLAKRHIVLSSIRAVDLAMELLGSRAYRKDLPFERALRDVRAGITHPLPPERTLIEIGACALEGDLGIVAEGDATLAQAPDRRGERLGRDPDREVERGGLRHPHERERPAVEHE